jgi:hypothetical protein
MLANMFARTLNNDHCNNSNGTSLVQCSLHGEGTTNKQCVSHPASSSRLAQGEKLWLGAHVSGIGKPEGRIGFPESSLRETKAMCITFRSPGY